MKDKKSIYKLDDITEKIGDGLHGTPKYDENGTIPFVNGNNISNGKINRQFFEKYINIFEFKKYKQHHLKGAVLISLNGTIGNVGILDDNEYLFGKSIGYINCGDKINNIFLKYYLESSVAQNIFKKELSGSTIKNLSLSTLKNLKLNVPDIEEQVTYGKLLSSMDQLIVYTQNQAHYTQIKKNFLSSMIFTNNNGASSFIKFESTVNYISSNLSMSSVTGSSNYPVYGANSIVGFTEKYISDKKYISIVKDGAGVGRTQKCDPKTNILGTMGAMTVNEGFDFDYIVQFLNSVKWDIYISGSTIPHLYFNDYKNLKLLTKTIDQQVKYGKLLSSMDQLSDLYKSYSENLQEQKKYNLNKIFS